MTIYNKRKPLKMHITFLRDGKYREFQISTPRHIAFVASVVVFYDEIYFTMLFKSLIAARHSSSSCLLYGMC